MSLARTLMACVLVSLVTSCCGNRVGPDGARSARVQAYDVLARPGEEVILRAKAERRGALGIHPDLHGVSLVYRSEGREIGRARTGDDGLAGLLWRVPASGRADLRIEVSFAEGSGYAGSPSTLLLAVRDGTRPILVTDIDHTIADVKALEYPFMEAADIPELPRASEVLGRLARRFDVVYVTARDDGYIDRTRDWLALNGFPPGPVRHRDFRLTSPSAGAYKKAELTMMKAAWPSCAVGIGDRTADAKAYLSAGLTAILIGDADLPEGARRVGSWAEIEAILAAPPGR